MCTTPCRRDIDLLPEISCKKCGLRWTPRVERPKRCPRCSTKYDGPIVVGALLPLEVTEFLHEVDLDNYDKLLKDRIAAELEAWQLSEVEKGEVINKNLFQKSCEALKLLGFPERIIHR